MIKRITVESGYLDNLVRNDLVLADMGFGFGEVEALRSAEVKY